MPWKTNKKTGGKFFSRGRARTGTFAVFDKRTGKVRNFPTRTRAKKFARSQRHY